MHDRYFIPVCNFVLCLEIVCACVYVQAHVHSQYLSLLFLGFALLRKAFPSLLKQCPTYSSNISMILFQLLTLYLSRICFCVGCELGL